MKGQSLFVPVVGARGSSVRRILRSGFTLVELLVSMAIILILAGITLAALNIGANADRIPGGSRQTQSMILGARDRAIYAGEPRGLRLIKDPDIINPNITGPDKSIAASSFVFIGAPQSYGENRGTATVEAIDHDSDPLTPPQWWVTEDNPRLSSWGRMVQRGLLIGGARITFGDEARWYTLNATPSLRPSGGGRYWAQLTRGYAGKPPGESMYSGLNYRVTLAPSVLPGEEPRTLPRGVVVDLMSGYVDGKIPPTWYSVTSDGGDGSAGYAARLNDTVVFINNLDIVFNERGTVYGPLASQGVLSLLVADGVDVQSGFRARHSNSGLFDINGDGVNDERASPESVIAIYTNSGTVSVTPVDETVSSSDPNVRTDPWFLAETGGEG